MDNRRLARTVISGLLRFRRGGAGTGAGTGARGVIYLRHINLSIYSHFLKKNIAKKCGD